MSHNKGIRQAEKKTKAVDAEIFKMDKEDMEFVAHIVNNFKVSEQVATNRVKLIKQFTSRFAKSFPPAGIAAIVDGIAAGILVPHDNDLNAPMSMFLAMFDTQVGELEKRGEKTDNATMSMKIQFMGKEFRVTIEREDDAAKRDAKVTVLHGKNGNGGIVLGADGKKLGE